MGITQCSLGTNPAADGIFRSPVTPGERAGRENGAMRLSLFTRVTGVLHLPDLLHDLIQSADH
jgi:hypothetical protein